MVTVFLNDLKPGLAVLCCNFMLLTGQHTAIRCVSKKLKSAKISVWPVYCTDEYFSDLNCETFLSLPHLWSACLPTVWYLIQISGSPKSGGGQTAHHRVCERTWGFAEEVGGYKMSYFACHQAHSAALHQWPHGAAFSYSAHTGAGLVCGREGLCGVCAWVCAGWGGWRWHTSAKELLLCDRWMSSSMDLWCRNTLTQSFFFPRRHFDLEHRCY